MKPPEVPQQLPDGTPFEKLWYVVAWGKKAKEWRGFLKRLGFRWSRGRMTWVMDRLDHESAEFFQGIVQEWIQADFYVATQQGFFIEDNWVGRKRVIDWKRKVSGGWNDLGRSRPRSGTPFK